MERKKIEIEFGNGWNQGRPRWISGPKNKVQVGDCAVFLNLFHLWVLGIKKLQEHKYPSGVPRTEQRRGLKI